MAEVELCISYIIIIIIIIIDILVFWLTADKWLTSSLLYSIGEEHNLPLYQRCCGFPQVVSEVAIYVSPILYVGGHRSI